MCWDPDWFWSICIWKDRDSSQKLSVAQCILLVHISYQRKSIMAGILSFSPARDIYFPYHSLLSLGIVGLLPNPSMQKILAMHIWVCNIYKKSTYETWCAQTIYYSIDTIIHQAKYTCSLFHHDCIIIIKNIPHNFS